MIPTTLQALSVLGKAGKKDRLIATTTLFEIARENGELRELINELDFDTALTLKRLLYENERVNTLTLASSLKDEINKLKNDYARHLKYKANAICKAQDESDILNPYVEITQSKIKFVEDKFNMSFTLNIFTRTRDSPSQDSVVLDSDDIRLEVNINLYCDERLSVGAIATQLVDNEIESF